MIASIRSNTVPRPNGSNEVNLGSCSLTLSIQSWSSARLIVSDTAAASRDLQTVERRPVQISIRHSCGYYLANRGFDTRLIQDYLGHRNIAHTVRYTRTAATRFEGLWR